MTTHPGRILDRHQDNKPTPPRTQENHPLMTSSPDPEARRSVDSPPPVGSNSLIPTGPTLTLTSHRSPRHAVVVVDGPIDYHTAPQLLGHLTAADMQHVPLLILDLTHVNFCDSSALGAFVDIHRRRSGTGHLFRLSGVHPDVRRILELTRLTSVLSLHETVEDALHE